MDDRDPEATLETGLGALDWRHGLTGTDLAAHLPSGDPLARLLRDHLPDGPYFSPRDVLSALPHAVRDEARGLPWRGFAPPLASPPVVSASAPAPNAADAAIGAGSPLAAGGPDPGAVGTTDAFPSGDPGTPTASASDGGRAGGDAPGAGNAWTAGLPDRVRQTASQARDQVLSIRTRSEGEPASGTEAKRNDGRSISAALDRFDRAVGDRPGKAASFASLGLTLALILGLDALRGRRNDGAARVGRLRPLLLAAWAAAVAVNAWDVWRGDGAGRTEGMRSAGTAWRDRAVAPPAPSAKAASAATDEYPTVGSA